MFVASAYQSAAAQPCLKPRSRQPSDHQRIEQQKAFSRQRLGSTSPLEHSGPPLVDPGCSRAPHARAVGEAVGPDLSSMRGADQQLCIVALAVRTNGVVGQVLRPSVQLTYYYLFASIMAEDFRQWSSVRLVGPTDMRPHFVCRAAEHRQRTGYRERVDLVGARHPVTAS
jgi:hypothetical protein